LQNARAVASQPLLLRLDGGNDSIENIDVVLEHNLQNQDQTDIDFLIKCNPRRQDKEDIIQLYADHGTSEQFHSEFKTDMDIERLSSGKFATNALVLACSVLVYNRLRWIGQNGLTGSRSPKRHKAKRRRIKTVMQDMMNIAARVIKTARRIKLSFGKGCCSFDAFSWVYQRLAEQ
jgi:hypothetical protein